MYKFELRMRLLRYASTTQDREVFAKCQVSWAIITAILTISDWIRV